MTTNELVKQLIDAGIHFGHRVGRWNPKMKPYIFGKRNLIHIINVKETVRGILAARKFLTKVVSSGKDVVFVGTKRQARKAVQDGADEIGMHWVIDRWLGGTLTNFREIRRRVTRLDELEQMDADGLMDAYSKKQGSKLRREMRKITRNLGGIRKMTSIPGAMVVIDQKREIIAIKEARKLHIPVIALIDTDSDPDLVDIPIPGNDDAMKAISLIMGTLVEATQAGLAGRAAKTDSAAEPQRRRSRRATTARADDSESPAPAETPAEAPAPAVETPAPTEAPAAPVAPAPVEAPAPAVETPADEAPVVAPEPAPQAAPAPEADLPVAEIVTDVELTDTTDETPAQA
ncbi:MAG: 30S ribosomal protein S2 [Phycisphaerae bacterium]|nr:30S ribosomal protein S2 [Phycisphaerae bacterium]